MSLTAQSSDADLVLLAQDGDQPAFAALIDRHRTLVLHLCVQVLHDRARAEDAVQEAILLAWLNISKLRRADRFGAWLAGIGLRVCHGWLRYRDREAWSLDALLGGRVLPEPVDWSATPVAQAEESELNDRVRRAVANLPRGQRAAVTLFYLTGLSHLETAELLGIHVGAVKARLHKARSHLRRTLWELWSEEYMTIETAIEFIEVHVEDVLAMPVADPPGDRCVVLLAETTGERVLPIWVGFFEGDSIAILLVRGEAIRPLTFPFAAALIAAAGGRLSEVRITRLTDETFYAQAIIESALGTRSVDARPSDAIALALETGAPIRVAGEVMDQAGKARVELSASATPDGRSARDHAEEIRTAIAQPRSRWTKQGLF